MSNQPTNFDGYTRERLKQVEERAAAAERRVAALEMAIARVGVFDPVYRDHILDCAAQIGADEIERFLIKARAM